MKNVLLHLRLPFSFFLLPIFLFAFSQSPQPDASKAWWVFFILHFLLFPASNAYNSYHDKDEGSIGLLENPPPVSLSLLYTANVFDTLAVGLGYWFVGPIFAAYLLIYLLVSRAYSHPSVRLKKRPVLSWFIVTLFQGAFTYLAVYHAILPPDVVEVSVWSHRPSLALTLATQWLPALICTSNLMAIYPITQVYQHEEDAQRGDLTMSRVLGIRGTFVNAAVWLSLSGLGFWIYFENKLLFLVLALLLFPVMAYLGIWAYRVWQDEHRADFKSTMFLNITASVCLNIFFATLYYLQH
jgi:4-hydroxybenzoate polyprenyltransferase